MQVAMVVSVWELVTDVANRLMRMGQEQAREEVDRRLAEEDLHRLNFEELHVINEQFERDLQGNSLRRRSPWRLWYARAEMRGAFGEGPGFQPVIKHVAPRQAEGMEDGLRSTPSTTVHEHFVAGGGDRQRGVMVLVRRAARRSRCRGVRGRRHSVGQWQRHTRGRSRKGSVARKPLALWAKKQ